MPRPIGKANAIVPMTTVAAYFLLPALAGRHDDADLISLTRRAVNKPTLAMQSERRAVSQKREVCETSLCYYQNSALLLCCSTSFLPLLQIRHNLFGVTHDIGHNLCSRLDVVD